MASIQQLQTWPALFLSLFCRCRPPNPPSASLSPSSTCHNLVIIFPFSFFFPPSCWTTRSGFHVIIAAHELQLIRDDSCKSFAPCLPGQVMVVVYRVTQTRRWDSSLGGVAADRDRGLDVRVSLAAPVYYSVNSLKLPSERALWGCSKHHHPPLGEPSCTPLPHSTARQTGNSFGYCGYATCNAAVTSPKSKPSYLLPSLPPFPKGGYEGG